MSVLNLFLTTSVLFNDSCHSRVIRNQQNMYPNFPPTAVVKLLHYSGLGSNTGMGFLRTNDLSEIKTGELNLDFGVWVKTGPGGGGGGGFDGEN